MGIIQGKYYIATCAYIFCIMISKKQHHLYVSIVYFILHCTGDIRTVLHKSIGLESHPQKKNTTLVKGSLKLYLAVYDSQLHQVFP